MPVDKPCENVQAEAYREEPMAAKALSNKTVLWL